MTLALIPAPIIAAFNPPRRILMGPGPSDVYPTVLAAQSKPTVGHLDPLFVGMMDELKQLLQYAFQTRNEMTLAISAPVAVRHASTEFAVPWRKPAWVNRKSAIGRASWASPMPPWPHRN